MSNQTEGRLNTTAAAGPPKKDERLERDRHLPTMPDPTQDEDREVRLPTDKDRSIDPSKKPSLIDQP